MVAFDESKYFANLILMTAIKLCHHHHDHHHPHDQVLVHLGDGVNLPRTKPSRADGQQFIRLYTPGVDQDFHHSKDYHEDCSKDCFDDVYSGDYSEDYKTMLPTRPTTRSLLNSWESRSTVREARVLCGRGRRGQTPLLGLPPPSPMVSRVSGELTS